MNKFKKKHPLLIIDPLALFIDGSLNDFRCVASSCLEIGWKAKNTKTTILGVHHATKARTDTGFKRVQDRVSGSGAFAGYTSTQCILVQGLEEEDRVYDTFTIIPHLTKPEEYRLVRQDDGYFALLEDYGKQKTMEEIRRQGKSFMPLQAFQNIAASFNVDDNLFRKWKDEGKDFIIESDFVRFL